MTSSPRTGARPRASGRRLLPADPLLRRLVLMGLVNSVGDGLFVTVNVLFFTRSIGLTPTSVALGLTVAGVCGVLAGVPMGRLADRVGSKRLLLAVGPLEAAAVLGYAFVHSFAAFVVLACAATALSRGAAAVRSALIARALPAEGQVRARALLRSVMNAGLVVGSGGAALALQADSYTGYVTMLVLDAVSFLGVTVLLAGLPVGAVTAAGARATGAGGAARATGVKGATGAEGAGGTAADDSRGPRTALRDRRYLLVTALHAVLELQLAVLTVGLPLWIVLGTGAPAAVLAAVNVVNCLLVVVFQVRASRGVTDVASAARACSRGALLLAGGCLVYAAAQYGPAWAAAGALLAGALVHTLGELLTSAGGWTLSLDLADPGAHGEYQGVFMSGQAAAHVIGPLVVTLTAVDHGAVGWVVLAGVFALAGPALTAAVRGAAPGAAPGAAVRLG
ncbi:MFS transporter [Kitasatospora purpeofusca]|uniref:MFS transporter n=1 Tax=Kitasatospora purpeofusca TaxID=67352 RepID=UPI002A5A4931|nr:MFS transporter [Kitasatospora purpeofusca]MDY0810962.1 MFS transporter [Kitasatospora purpeofusca]